MVELKQKASIIGEYALCPFPRHEWNIDLDMRSETSCFGRGGKAKKRWSKPEGGWREGEAEEGGGCCQDINFKGKAW